MPGKIGPFADGGDMDDPNNPASPFMARERVEEIAAAELGMTDEELAQVRAADAEQGEHAQVSRERALELLTGALMGRISVVRDRLAALHVPEGRPVLKREIDECVQELTDVLPQ